MRFFRSTDIENLEFMVLFPFLLMGVAVIFEYSGLDLWWVSHFFDTQNQIWLYKKNWFFNTIIHSGGQLLDRIFVLIWLLLFIFINLKKKFTIYRKFFLFFLLASVTGPILVGIGKNLTHIHTPWDLQLFNGIYPYIRLLDPTPEGVPVGYAFPAGHASGGYCFLSLYFALLHFRSPYRIFGLVFGVCLGLVFGLGQQIRGAHFPSHDLFTLVICWYAAMAVYLLFYPKEYRMLKNIEIVS
jgi:membrane-associated PAP2 superfamily phosphatase